MIGLRKLTIMLIIVIIAVVLRTLGLLDSTDTSNLISTSAVAFFAANLVGKFTKEDK